MDAELQNLRESRPTPGLRAGYFAAIQAEGQAKGDHRRPVRQARWFYGLASVAAVLLLVVAIWIVLQPNLGTPSHPRSQGIVPTAKSAEVGSFVWQTDGVYGYEMLRPAGWSMADLGTLRSYAAPGGGDQSGGLELQVLNLKARPDAPDGTSGVPEGMRELRDRFDAAPNLSDWTKATQELMGPNQPAIAQVSAGPDAVIYQIRYDPTSRVKSVIFALVVKEGQPLILALNAGGQYGDLQALRASGVWDDFLTMIVSVRPIPPDVNNVQPWAPTAMPTPDRPRPVVTPAPTALPVFTPEPAPTDTSVIWPPQYPVGLQKTRPFRTVRKGLVCQSATCF